MHWRFKKRNTFDYKNKYIKRMALLFLQLKEVR